MHAIDHCHQIVHTRINPQLIPPHDFSSRSHAERCHSLIASWRSSETLRIFQLDILAAVFLLQSKDNREIFRTILSNVLFELDAGIGSLERLWLVRRHSYRMLMHLALYHLPTEGCVILAAANIQPFSFENDKIRAADNDDDDDFRTQIT